MAPVVHRGGQEPLSLKVPDNKVHGANMGPISGRQDPGGPHVGPMNFAIWGCTYPAKRDRCFPPPIAERQRLPNVGIDSDHVTYVMYEN